MCAIAGNTFLEMFAIDDSEVNLCPLAHHPVPPHGLFRIKIRFIANNIIIYLTFFLFIKYYNTYSKIHIYHYLVVIDFILHHTSILFF